MNMLHRIALVSLLAALPVSGARALTVDQYLKIRRASDFDARLTYAHLQAAPGAYAGRSVELRGSVDGFVRKEDSLAFLLTLDDQKGLLLTADLADSDILTSASHQKLRILAKVGPGVTGNVVPLSVIAVANDAEVTARERQAEARMEYEARKRQAASTAPVPTRSAAGTPSRGTSAPRTASGPPGPVSDMARTYLSPEAQAAYPYYRSYILGCNPRLTERELDTITVCVLYFGQKYSVDPRLVVALIIVESDFDPRSTSHKGAMGLAQLMPDEARANRLTDPYDPIQNIGTAVSLLRLKLDKYAQAPLRRGYYTVDEIKLALAAYNAGPGAVKKYGGVPPYRETQGYIKKILRIYSELIKGD